MKKGFLMLSSLLSFCAMAEEKDKEFLKSFSLDSEKMTILIEANLYTDHSDATYVNEIGHLTEYNEDNNVKGIGIKSGTITLGFSKFDNSYFEKSKMVTLEHDLISIYDFEVQVGLGLTSGYNENILVSDLYVGDLLFVPLVTLQYSPSLLEYNGFQVSPKIRSMGFHAYMFNVELGYSF